MAWCWHIWRLAGHEVVFEHPHQEGPSGAFSYPCGSYTRPTVGASLEYCKHCGKRSIEGRIHPDNRKIAERWIDGELTHDEIDNLLTEKANNDDNQTSP